MSRWRRRWRSKSCTFPNSRLQGSRNSSLSHLRLARFHLNRSARRRTTPIKAARKQLLRCPARKRCTICSNPVRICARRFSSGNCSVRREACKTRSRFLPCGDFPQPAWRNWQTRQTQNLVSARTSLALSSKSRALSGIHYRAPRQHVKFFRRRQKRTPKADNKRDAQAGSGTVRSTL